MTSGRSPRPSPRLFCVLVVLGALLALGCGLTELLQDSDQGGSSQPPPPQEEMTLEEALAVEPQDRRPTLLAEMGIPDAFTIHFEELEGQVVRWESWSYFDDLTTFDFLDGEFLWTVELAPVPDGSLFAHFYSPTDFQAYMSVAEARAQLPDQDLTEIDLTDGGAPGGQALVGEQIMFGFDQDRLVYVETFILQPDGEEVLSGLVATATTSIDAAAESDEAAPATVAAATEQTAGRATDGATMVYVPSGDFVMGGTDEPGGEGPAHAVTLSAFWLDRTEVTNAQYQLCVDAGQCPERYYASDPTFGNSQQPVVAITWSSAADYCAWVGARLPTEAEWVYAARGPEGSVYPWGDAFRPGSANCAERACQDGVAGPAPVGSFPDDASWVGALDVAGNVEEWTADWYGPYPSTPQTNPTGPEVGTDRVVRGGRWDSDATFLSLAWRGKIAPTYPNAYRGFRCASSQRP